MFTVLPLIGHQRFCSPFDVLFIGRNLIHGSHLPLVALMRMLQGMTNQRSQNKWTFVLLLRKVTILPGMNVSKIITIIKALIVLLTLHVHVQFIW